MVARRVVFDCNVLFQALISPQGPAGAAVDAVRQRKLQLYLSIQVFDELRDVAMRPHLASRFRITDERLRLYIRSFWDADCRIVSGVPHVFDFPRDPDDAHYVDLAVAVDAELIVSRDADLLSLADAATPEGRDFLNRFPHLRILTPPQLLSLLDSTSA